MSEQAVTVDREKWGRFLYLLIREHALVESRARLPEWDGLTSRQRRGWMSDASEFIRGWEQKRGQVESTLAQAVRHEHGERIAQAIEAEHHSPVLPARIARDLSPEVEGETHGDPFLSPRQANPTAGTPEDAAAQLDMASNLDRALKAREGKGQRPLNRAGDCVCDPNDMPHRHSTGKDRG